MSDKPETLSAIIAEMRDFCSGWSEDVDVTVKVGIIYGWICRIEAAAERERTAHTNDIHDALYLATGIPGNAAAMREALEQALAYCESDQKSGIAYSDNDVLVPMLRAALAAPARNCDRFATAEEAVAAFADHLRAWENAHGICSEYPDHAVKVPAGAFAWLFDKAEGGEE